MAKHRTFRKGDDVYFNNHVMYHNRQKIILNGKYTIDDTKYHTYGLRSFTLFYFINTEYGRLVFNTIKHFLNEKQYMDLRLSKIKKIINANKKKNK